MLKYVLKRLIMLIPVMLGVVVIIFTLLYITPGDPVDNLVGTAATPEQKEVLRAELGLNTGYLERLFNYVTGLLKGDMGMCFVTRQGVSQRIAQAYPNTLKLSAFTALFSVILGLIFGIISAVKQYSIFDNIVMSISMIGNSIPSFWLALMLMLAFCLHFRWFPASGFNGLKSYVLPAISLGLQRAAAISRMTRSSMLEVIRQDYITTAKAKGQTPWHIIMSHALRNAMIPIVTSVGIQFGILIGGAVLVEQIFAIPGIGKLMVDAINQRNYPVVQGSVLVVALSYCLINLVVDLLYAYINPRIKSQYS